MSRRRHKIIWYICDEINHVFDKSKMKQIYKHTDLLLGCIGGEFEMEELNGFMSKRLRLYQKRLCMLFRIKLKCHTYKIKQGYLSK